MLPNTPRIGENFPIRLLNDHHALCNARGRRNDRDKLRISSIAIEQRMTIRKQELQLLDTEIRLQQITRAQAIQQWGQLQYSWQLP